MPASSEDLDKVLQYVDEEKLYLYSEPALNGAPWPELSQPVNGSSRGLAVYSHDKAVLNALKKRGIISDKALSTETEDGTLYKASIIKEAVASVLLSHPNARINGKADEYALHGLTKAQNTQVAIAPCNGDASGNAAIVIRAPSMEAIESALKQSRLISKRPPYLNYTACTSDDHEGYVAVATIPNLLAHAIRRTNENDVAEFADFISVAEDKEAMLEGRFDNEDLLNFAAAHLPAINKGGPKPPKNKKAPVQTTPSIKVDPKPLSELAEGLEEHIIAHQTERRIDGTLNHYIEFTLNDNIAKPLLKQIDAISSPDKCSDAIKLYEVGRSGSTVRYALDANSYEQLSEATDLTAISQKEELPAQLKPHIFNTRKSTQVDGSTHIQDVMLYTVKEGAHIQHYLAAVATASVGSPYARARAFSTSLDGSHDVIEPEFLTAQNETPAIVRVKLTSQLADDIANQFTALAATKEAKKTHFSDKRNNPFPSTQHLDEELREDFPVEQIPEQDDGKARKASGRYRKEKAKTAEPIISYEQQQEEEFNLLSELEEIIQTQEGKDKYIAVAFANLSDEKAKQILNPKTGKYEPHIFQWEEPVLYVRLSEENIKKLKARRQQEFPWLKIDWGASRREGSGKDIYQTAAFYLSPEATEYMNEELFGSIPTLSVGETVSSLNIAKTMSASAALAGLAALCEAEQARVALEEEAFEKGLSAADLQNYRAYKRWKDSPESSTKPTDDIIEHIEATIARHEKKQTQERAYKEIQSKTLLAANVEHLSDAEIAQIEIKWAGIEASNESLKALHGQMDGLYDKLTALLNPNTKESPSNDKKKAPARIKAVHPEIPEKIQSLAHKAGRLKATSEELSQDIEAITGQVESYKTWVTEVGKDRSVRHVLVIKPTSKTAQLIEALEDDAHMTRAPIQLTNPLGNGSDVVLLFPTAKLMQALGNNTQALSDHPLRPEDIIPKARAKLNPTAEHTSPAIIPRAKSAKEVITREAKSAFASLRPHLVYERQEHSYTDHQAAQPIGEQAVLVFDIAGKRDLAQLKKLVKILDENDLTHKPQYYGGLSDDSSILSPQEQKAKTLIEVVSCLEGVKKFIQEFSREFNELHYSSPQTQARIEAKRVKLPEQINACKEAVVTLIEAGIALEHSPVDDIEAFSAALEKHNHTHTSLKDAASAVTRTLNLSKMQCDEALAAYEDVADSASKARVAIKTHTDCLFADDIGIDLGQIDTQLGMLGDKRQLIKLYISPAASEALIGLKPNIKNALLEQSPSQNDRALTAAQITENWKAAVRHRQ